MTVPSTAFAENQFLEAYPDGIEKHYWNYGRNLILKHLLKTPTDSGKILEIGAGRGIVVQFLMQSGFDIWGCELSSATPITPELKDRLFQKQNAFELSEAFRRNVKTVLLLDVLEHIENPKVFLAQCESKFPNLNAVLITVPARQELWSNYDEQYGHYKRYDLGALQELTKSFSGNWRIKSKSYFFHLLYPIARLLLLAKSKRETTLKAPQSTLSKFAHKMMGYCFSLEAVLLPKTIAGTSAYILFQKNK